MRPALLLLATLAAWAADPAPAWVTPEGRATAYPESAWLVAWSEEHVAPERPRERCLEIVRESAQAELARSIRVRVEAKQDQRTVEISGGSGARFEQSFASNSRLSSDVTLEGRKLETWSDDAGGRVLALCAVERARFAEACRLHADAGLTELAAAADAAQAHLDGGRPGEAGPAWARVLAAVRGIGDDLILARGTLPSEADAPLAARLASIHNRATAALAGLVGRAVHSADDLAFALATQLVRGAGETKPLALVPAATVRDTRLSSPFGRNLSQTLAAQLALAGWPISRASAGGPARDAATAAGAEAVVLVSTWDLPDGGLRAAVAIYRMHDGRLLAAAEAVLPQAGVAASGLATAPQNASAAIADQLQLKQDEILAGGLRLEVWTSKGDDAPVFARGEKVQLFVRVDRACHLRAVYHLADGRRALLIDDLWIDDGKANQVYQLPDEFVVDAPFGGECLQVNASTRAFAKLATKSEDGYPVISEALSEATAKTRGLKKVEAELRQAECRVVVTTVER